MSEPTPTAELSHTAALLESLEQGGFMREVDDDLAAVIEAVERTGLDGSLTLKLTIERKGTGQMIVKPAPPATKIPRDPPMPAIRWLSQGKLVETNPAQLELDFGGGGKVTPMHADG